MREREKMTYAGIGGKLRMTPEKARDTYEPFYHEKVMKLAGKMEKDAKGFHERLAIWNMVFNGIVLRSSAAMR